MRKPTRWKITRYWLWISFLHVLAACILGVALFPMAALPYFAWKALAAYPIYLKLFALSFSIGLGYFVFGVTIILLAILVKSIFRFEIKPGLISLYSKEGLWWLGYNMLILIVNATFLDVLRVSPCQALFYRLMGAKIGKNVMVNTAGLADLALLQIGDNVVVGGGVALICHSVDRGLIRLTRTVIGSNVTIGLNTVIMPGCQIGDNALVAPCSYLTPGTVIPPKGAYGGNPLRDLRAERRERNAVGNSDAS